MITTADNIISIRERSHTKLIHHTSTINDHFWIYCIIALPHIKVLNFGTNAIHQHMKNMQIWWLQKKPKGWHGITSMSPTPVNKNDYNACKIFNNRTKVHGIIMMASIAILESKREHSYFQVSDWSWFVWLLKVIDFDKTLHAAEPQKGLSIHMYSAINQNQHTFMWGDIIRSKSYGTMPTTVVEDRVV